MGLTREDVADNIRYHWPFLTSRPDSYNFRTAMPSSLAPSLRAQALLKEAQYFFIAPIIKNHVENGILYKAEIARLLRSQENPRGVSGHTIIKIVKQEYDASSWAGFLNLHGAKLTPQSLFGLTNEEFKKVGGASQEDYLKFTLASYIIKGYDQEDVLNELSSLDFSFGSKSQMQRYIYKWWGSFYEARRQLVAPILALAFKLGYTSTEIRERIPFFQRRITGCPAGEAVNYFCKEWFRISPTQARAALAHRTLNDFLNEFLNNQ